MNADLLRARTETRRQAPDSTLAARNAAKPPRPRRCRCGVQIIKGVMCGKCQAALLFGGRR